MYKMNCEFLENMYIQHVKTRNIDVTKGMKNLIDKPPDLPTSECVALCVVGEIVGVELVGQSSCKIKDKVKSFDNI